MSDTHPTSDASAFHDAASVSCPRVGSDTNGLYCLVNHDRVYIKDHRYDHRLVLDKHEAMALRDWLNEVLT